MTLRFPILDDEKAYLGTWLFLPKKYIAEQVLRSSLTLPIDQTRTMVCFQDHPNHLAVPRCLIPRAELETQFPVVDLIPASQEHTVQSDITLDMMRPDRSVQHDSVEAMIEAGGGILNLSCVAGDTILGLNRGGKGFSMPISTVYERLRGGRYAWDTSIPTKIRSLKENWVGLHRLVDVVCTGVKETVVLRLTNGKTVTLTPDHRVLTSQGWVPAGELHCGDLVVTDATAPSCKDSKIEDAHCAHHTAGYVGFGYGMPFQVEVESVTPGPQTQVYDVICDDPHHNFAGNGIILHNCGMGKTVIALELVARLKKKTLIVVKGDGLIGQWRDQIQDRLKFPTELGLIQGPVNSWKWEGCAITLASLDTLARHHANVPAELRRSMGVVVWDECHSVAAMSYSKTAALFPGQRFGLTATVHREDDMESVFLWHIGPVAFSDLTQDLIPTVTLLPSPIDLRLNDPYVYRQVCDKRRELSHTKLMNYVANLEQEINFVERHLREAVNAGRRILAISWSKDQLNTLHKRFPQSGLITGDVKGATARQRALSDHQLTFGIAQLAREALDEAELDTLFILTEYRSAGMLQQSVGRIQRLLKGRKKSPRVVIIQHNRVQGISHRARHMIRYFRAQGFTVEEAPQR